MKKHPDYEFSDLEALSLVVLFTAGLFQALRFFFTSLGTVLRWMLH